MSHEKQQVRKFYEEIWNKHNKGVVPEVLHESFKFKGSLGLERQGYTGFIEYLDMVHSALGNYRCEILEMIAEPSKVFVKMRFSGIHKAKFMGFHPSNRKVTWDGAALFYFRDEKISEVWVLGDLKSLESQLSGHQT